MAQSNGSSPAPDVPGLEGRQSAEAETLRDEWDTLARWNDVIVPTPLETSSGSGARCGSSTPWPAPARSACGNW